MAKLRRQMHQRMLGTGYCARPVELDCHSAAKGQVGRLKIFDRLLARLDAEPSGAAEHVVSICESCTFFVTTNQFRPTLQAQREDEAW